MGESQNIVYKESVRERLRIFFLPESESLL